MNKFVNIKIEGETTIGVIDLGKIPLDKTEIEKCDIIKVVALPKLKVALQEHFDVEVNIIHTNVLDSSNRITVECTIEIGETDNTYKEIVLLTETWVY